MSKTKTIIQPISDSAWEQTQNWLHTPSIAFRHLPPNSARFGYATKGALSISVQLSTDAASTLWKVWVLIWLWKHKHPCKHETHPPRVKKKRSSISIQTIVVLFVLV